MIPRGHAIAATKGIEKQATAMLKRQPNSPEAHTYLAFALGYTGDTAGAGLGLAIVRDLVRAHGGEVELESTPGSGTIVRCRFPVG